MHLTSSYPQPTEKNLRIEIVYTSHEVPERQTSRRFSINRDRTTLSQRPEEEKVLLELKAWGLLRERGSMLDLPSGKQDHKNHLCRRNHSGEKERTLWLLFLLVHNLSPVFMQLSPCLRPVAQEPGQQRRDREIWGETMNHSQHTQLQNQMRGPVEATEIWGYQAPAEADGDRSPQ